MTQALRAIEHETREREQGSPLDLVSDEIDRIESLGAAFLALAEKEDLSGRFGNIVKLMVEAAGMIEDKLEAWEPAL